MKQHAALRMNLLDIFGNAETPNNRNSSRFVKVVQVRAQQLSGMKENSSLRN